MDRSGVVAALRRAVATAGAQIDGERWCVALSGGPDSLALTAIAAAERPTTALIVAHRPSTVMLADRVALLEDGRITAVGTHSDLLATSDHYRFVISSLEDEQNEEILEEVNL